MGIYDYLIIAIVAAWGLFSVAVVHLGKKKGKRIGCSGNCSCCSSGCHGRGTGDR